MSRRTPHEIMLEQSFLLPNNQSKFWLEQGARIAYDEATAEIERLEVENKQLRKRVQELEPKTQYGKCVDCGIECRFV